MTHNRIEALEARRLLTAFVVDTFGDAAGDGDGSTDGLISLREAVIAAGVSAAGRVVSEDVAGPLEHHIAEWPDGSDANGDDGDCEEAAA